MKVFISWSGEASKAGAVSGHFGEMKVAPLLLEGDLKELCDPIAAFQCTSFDK